MLDANRVRELINYDPETGLMTRLNGKPCSENPSKEGYRVVYLDGKNYLQHRVAWAYMTGEWPRSRMDHRNMDRLDNRFCNLRECDVSQNLMNTAAHKDNKRG